jgi:hypothetical protein
MNSVKAIITKNIILVCILIFTIGYVLYRPFHWHALLALQLGLGGLYALFSYIEYGNRSFLNNLPNERFAYYPGSFFMFRIIKTGLFLMFGIVLIFVPSIIKVLYPICFVIAFTEILVGLVKYSKRLSFVSVIDNYILIGRESIEKIFASELERVEYRHDIIYLVKKDRKTSVIKVFSISEHDKFLRTIKAWIAKNGVEISEESSQRLKEF